MKELPYSSFSSPSLTLHPSTLPMSPTTAPSPTPNPKPSPVPIHHELEKIGHFLNYSDDDDDDDDNVDDFDKSSASDAFAGPTSSLSEMPPSPSREPDAKPYEKMLVTSATRASSPSPDDPSASYVAELKSAVLSSNSATDAALAFQRWRHARLKMIFSQELKKALEAARQDEALFVSLNGEMERKDQHMMPARANSSQLRNRISTLENTNNQQQESSEVEILQQDLLKALERASSAELEVERYNKEIWNLRERLKSSEDEACRLDSELKATTALMQKERTGMAEENRVLLEQLSRKDEEVLSKTQELNSLKSILAGMKVSRMELERLKSELHDHSKMEIDYAKYEEKENKQLQSLAETGQRTSVVHVPKPQTMAENAAFFPQLLEMLQKLIMCLQKSDHCQDPSMKRASPNVLSSDPLAAKEASRQGGMGDKGSTNRDSKKTFVITCWKWRWAAAAYEVQALTRELDRLKSHSKEDLHESPFMSGLLAHIPEKGGLSMHKHAECKSVKIDQFPLPVNKFFSLLASIWQSSSQSIHLEKELVMRRRQMEHFLCVMTRWMQRIWRKRQLQKAIIHWLLYLLKSQRNKFKRQPLAKADSTGAICISKQKNSDPRPKYVARDCLQVSGRRNNYPKYEKGSVRSEIGALIHHDNPSEKASHILKDVFHHKLEEVENVIRKEASAWILKQFPEKHNLKYKTTNESKRSMEAAGLASKICSELKRCIDSEKTVILHIPNKESDVENVEAANCVKVCTPRSQVKIHTIKKPARGKL